MAAKIERKRIKYQTQPDARERQLVRVKVYGKLPPKPCRVCGSEQSEMHHPDYNDPFTVEYLCRKHHAQLHAEMRRSA